MRFIKGHTIFRLTAMLFASSAVLNGETVVARSSAFVFHERAVQQRPEPAKRIDGQTAVLLRQADMNGKSIHLQLSHSVEAGTVQVFSARGRIVGWGKINGSKATISLAGRRPIGGWYGIHIHCGDETIRYTAAILP